MRHEVVQRLAQEMTRQRERMLEDLEAAEQDLRAIGGEPSIDLEERAEDARETILIDRLDDRRRREIEEIDRALRRISEGAYGTCERCGKAVSEARLTVLPATPVCRSCATVSP